MSDQSDQSNIEMVLEHHLEHDIPVAEEPQESITLERAILRLDLIDFEVEKLREACLAKDSDQIASALADLAYVAYGMGLEYGIDLDAKFAEHAAAAKRDGTWGPDDPEGPTAEGPA